MYAESRFARTTPAAAVIVEKSHAQIVIVNVGSTTPHTGTCSASQKEGPRRRMRTTRGPDDPAITVCSMP